VAAAPLSEPPHREPVAKIGQLHVVAAVQVRPRIAADAETLLPGRLVAHQTEQHRVLGARLVVWVHYGRAEESLLEPDRAYVAGADAYDGLLRRFADVLDTYLFTEAVSNMSSRCGSKNRLSGYRSWP